MIKSEKNKISKANRKVHRSPILKYFEIYLSNSEFEFLYKSDAF